MSKKAIQRIKNEEMGSCALTEAELEQVAGGNPYGPSGPDPCSFEYKLVCRECGTEAAGLMTAAEKTHYFNGRIPPSRFCMNEKCDRMQFMDVIRIS